MRFDGHVDPFTEPIDTPSGGSSGGGFTAADHAVAPYADALRANARGGWVRLGVPGHQDAPARHPAVRDLAGEHGMSMDIPMFTEGVDIAAPDSDSPAPLDRALALAADAWGARRTWFLSNGASQGNHAACFALRALGDTVIAQRSMHSSVVDGAILAGLGLHFVQPNVDPVLGIAHGITPEALRGALSDHPEAAAAYVVSPSYFGAVSDVRALADIAHAHGIPLVVDEAWGAHLGFHPDLPASALQCGADLVISSTHKLAGSLTQSAMLHLGPGPYADALEPHIVRALNALTTTSPSALLLGSLDAARRDLMTHPPEWIGASIADTDRVRELIAVRGRFTPCEPAIRSFPDVVALDPLHLVIDVRSGGVPGHDARQLLEDRSRIHVELATDAVIVCIVGAGSRLEPEVLADALHGLPARDLTDRAPVRLPDPGPRALGLREAYFAPTEIVTVGAAVGRISADSLAAYPPGVPNVLPGEVLTAEVLNFLRQTATEPYGWVRGAIDPSLEHVRVLVR